MADNDISHTFTQAIGDNIRLNRWIFDIIQPYIKGRTLELGSSQGGISSIFVEHGLPIHLTDEKEVNRVKLSEIFQEATAIRMIHDINFLSDDFEQTYAAIIGAFDTVIAINVTEHGFYDKIALNNAKSLLRIRGHFMLIAPAYTAFYNGLEEELNEWKRHNAIVVKKLMGEKFEVLKVRYFNWVVDPTLNPKDQSGLSTLAIFRKTYG